METTTASGPKLDPEPNPKPDPKPQISLEDVHFSYPGDADEALRGVTLRIRAGEHVCILGGNGSGKSTLVQLINALLLPTGGRVNVLGLDTAEPSNALAIRQQAAMVFQHPEDQMVTSVVADDVAFGPENLSVPQPEIARRVDEALTTVGMATRAESDPADLSGGQKQRVAIAGALAMHPRILLLDEPSAMLDAGGRQAVRQTISDLHRRGITIVHVTHFMEDAQRASRVIVMHQGCAVLDGTPEQVFEHRSRMHELGLETPFAMQVEERLRACGMVGLPVTADTDVLAEAVAERLTGKTEAETGNRRQTLEQQDSRDQARTNEGPGNETASDTVISFENVSFSYAAARSARKRTGKSTHKRGSFISTLLGGRKQRSSEPEQFAQNNVSFHIAQGSLTALVGHTGSGKSTTVELACALKLPYAGTVRVGGIDTADLSRRRELRKLVGYVSQLPERQLFAETVFDDVAFGPRNLGLGEDEIEARVREALAAVNLPATDALLSRSPFSLSGGQQRSVALAGVLAMHQRILVLDEPMAGLDPAGRAHTRDLLLRLKRSGITLILVTHSMDDVAELADHVLALDDGKLVADGTPAEVFRCAQADGAPSSKFPAELGLPSALSFAHKLQNCNAHLKQLPLTIGELAEEVARYGTAR